MTYLPSLPDSPTAAAGFPQALPASATGPSPFDHPGLRLRDGAVRSHGRNHGAAMVMADLASPCRFPGQRVHPESVYDKNRSLAATAVPPNRFGRQKAGYRRQVNRVGRNHAGVDVPNAAKAENAAAETSSVCAQPIERTATRPYRSFRHHPAGRGDHRVGGGNLSQAESPTLHAPIQG